jgi:hypothetical protein
MIRRGSLPGIAVLLFGLASCVQPPVKPTDPVVTSARYPLRRGAVDVLVVLTMGNSTENLRDGAMLALSKLHEALGAGAANSPSLRIGVITSYAGAGPYAQPPCPALGHGGKLQLRPHWDGTSSADAWVQVDGSASNVQGPGADKTPAEKAFALLAANGGVDYTSVRDCPLFGYVQPLEASRLALLPKTNPGFRRPGALLAVIYVQDTMDCSLADHALFDPKTASHDHPLGPYSSFRCFEHGFRCDQSGRGPGPRTNCAPVDGYLHHPRRYIDFLRHMGAPGEVLVAAIAGELPPQLVVKLDGVRPYFAGPSCYEGGSQPPLRLRYLLEAFTPTLHQAKCEPAYNDYRPFLSKVGEELRRRLALHCLPAALRANPPGATRCAVELERAGQRSEIEPCGAEGAPHETCWRAAAEPACGLWGGQRFDLVGTTPASGELVVTCTTR